MELLLNLIKMSIENSKKLNREIERTEQEVKKLLAEHGTINGLMSIQLIENFPNRTEEEYSRVKNFLIEQCTGYTDQETYSIMSQLFDWNLYKDGKLGKNNSMVGYMKKVFKNDLSKLSDLQRHTILIN